MFDPGAVQFQRLKALRGIPATIARGGSSTNITVVLDQVGSPALTIVSVSTSAAALDVLIAFADYAPTGSPSEPQTGDEIAFSQQGQALTAQVMPPSDSDDCSARWPGGAVWKVHTKIVSVV